MTDMDDENIIANVDVALETYLNFYILVFINIHTLRKYINFYESSRVLNRPDGKLPEEGCRAPRTMVP
jgi:hypothetical protein